MFQATLKAEVQGKSSQKGEVHANCEEGSE